VKKELLFITDSLPFPVGRNGSTTINGNLLPFLAEEFDVHYCCLNDDQLNEALVRETKQYVKSLHLVEPRWRAPMVSWLAKIIRFLVLKPHETVAVASNEMKQVIDRLEAEGSIDVIFADLHFYAPLVSNSGLPKLVSPHDSRALLYASFREAATQPLAALYYRIHSWVLKRFEARTFNSFDRVLFVSARDADYASDYIASEKIQVIANGVDLSSLQTPVCRKPGEPMNLVFSGKLDYKPNLDAVDYLCKRLLPELLKRIPDLHLTIVGDNSGYDWRSASAAVPGTLTFTGYVENIVEELGRHSLYICPLSSGAGFKNKVLDAVAAGLPLIGSAMSFDGMVFNDGEDILVTDLENMVENIVRVAADADGAHAMACRAQEKLLDNYRWSAIAEQYIRVINDTIEERDNR